MNFNGKIGKSMFGKEKLSAIMITLTIIAVLILSGPASAFVVSLTGFSIAEPVKGNKISTTASVEINSGERMIMPNPIGVFVDGTAVCVFSINGQAGDCDGTKGISVSLVSNTSNFGYGYGYGYGYSYGYGYQNGYSTGKFTYNITLDTSNFTIGDHRIQLKVNAGNDHVYSSVEQKITIKPQGAESTETNENVAPGTEESFDNVKITLNGTDNARITVSEFSERPNGTSTFSIPELGKYYQIEANTSNIGETLIKAYYTDAEVSAAGLNESTLKLYFWDIGKGKWESPLESGVNTAGNYVWAKTNHFSIWGMFGNTVPIVSTTTTNSNGGDCLTSWSCSEWETCANGEQTRTCTKEKSYCYAGTKPAETQLCTTPVKTAATDEETLINTTPATGGRSAGITGAAIGALGTSGMVLVLVFIIMIVVLAIAVVIVRRKKAAY